MKLREQVEKIKTASLILAGVDSNIRNLAINAIADAIEENVENILAVNKADMDKARKAGMPENKLNRLMLNEGRIADIAANVRQVAQLPDCLEGAESWRRPNGMIITKKRVPLGVVAMIYENRPSLTVDGAVICLKSGNGVLLRSGEEALNTNTELVRVIKLALERIGLPTSAVELFDDSNKKALLAMLKMDDLIDVIIPRGGPELIRSIKEDTTIPMIETGAGNCHVYIDDEADIAMAWEILINAKIHRPAICNSCETLLIHSDIARQFLMDTRNYDRLMDAGLEIRGCPKTLKIISCASAVPADYDTEYNDLILAVKIVDSLDEAIAHVNRHGTRHSECIVTSSKMNAEKFQQLVDAACVYHNVSTRFSDGYEFGFGAEIGVSTQKLHARGPFALKELTTYKYVITGSGQTKQPQEVASHFWQKINKEKEEVVED